MIAEERRLTLHIAIAGNLPKERKKAVHAAAKLHRIIQIAKDSAGKFAADQYGFAADKVALRFVTSPSYISAELLDILTELFPEEPITGIGYKADEKNAAFSEYSVIEETVSDIDLIDELIADQSDFALICADDNTYRHLLMNWQQSCIPTVLLSTAQEGYCLRTDKEFFEDCDGHALAGYIAGLFPKKEAIETQAEKSVFGYKLLWSGLYRRYMKKNKPMDDEPVKADPLIDDDAAFDFLEDTQQKNREFLKLHFKKHDAAAIQYAEKYRSAIYLRAVVPLVTTIALAFGFYAESLLSPWKVFVPGTSLNLWSIITGLGFFVHALLNLYVYRLSKSRTIQAWHKSFIDNRFIAEALRIIIHFTPFGMPVSLNRPLSLGTIKADQNNDVIRRLRILLRSITPTVTAYHADNARECLSSLDGLIDGQITYHKNTANRLAGIVKKLEKRNTVIFYLGFGIVLLRGCLQLLFETRTIPLEEHLVSWLQSFSNMLALLIPIWAGYFALKLSLCSFKTLYNSNVAVTDGLIAIRRVVELSGDSGVTFHDLRQICDQTVAVMLGEISEWYRQIDTQKVTKL